MAASPIAQIAEQLAKVPPEKLQSVADAIRLALLSSAPDGQQVEAVQVVAPEVTQQDLHDRAWDRVRGKGFVHVGEVIVPNRHAIVDKPETPHPIPKEDRCIYGCKDQPRLPDGARCARCERQFKEARGLMMQSEQHGPGAEQMELASSLL